MFYASDDNCNSEFSSEWWTWLIATGVCLACTLGCKINGILIFFAIGAAVLVDLWDILDIKKGHSMVRGPSVALDVSNLAHY